MSDLFLDVQSTDERQIIDLRALGFRRMLSCGHYEYRRAHPPLAPQSHPDWLVLVYLARGFQLYEINGQRVELRGGHMMRVFPNEIYSTGKFPEHRGSLYWLILNADCEVGSEGAFGMEQAAAGKLVERLTDRSTQRVETASSLIEATFPKVFEISSPSDPLACATLRHRLVTVLLECGLAQTTGQSSAQLATEIARRLALDPVSMPTAEEMASFAGLSVSGFYDRFRKENGLTPKEFAMRWKINEAIKRLKEGRNVTVVAHELGFSSSQYFASTLKRHTGHTPTYWMSHKGNQSEVGA